MTLWPRNSYLLLIANWMGRFVPGFSFAVKQASVAFGRRNMGSSNIAVSLFVVLEKVWAVFD